MRVYYFPPSDPHTGELLDEASSLLAAARELPSEVRLWEGRSEQRRGEQGDEKVRPGWVSIDQSPVVPLQKLAHTYFEAEKYDRAAACYRRLRAQNPDKKHYKTMQVLCSRLAKGSDQKPSSSESGDTLKGADKEWIQWMEKMDRLHRSLDKGGAR